MIGVAGISILGIVILAADPPDMAGQWAGEEWGTVVLKRTADAAKAVFGPAREGVLPYGLPCEQQYFQFANGEVLVVGHGPATSREEFDEDWKKVEAAGGADMSIGSNVGIQLVGEGCIFTQDFENLRWDTFTAEQVASAMKRVNFSFGVVEPARQDLPVTYLFKTSRGEVGVLELLAVVDDGRGLHALGNGLKFRYKMAQSGVGKSSPDEPRPVEDK